MKRLFLLLVLSATGCIIESSSGDDGPIVPGPACGDGAVNQASEQCDDGNVLSGDGCSSLCATEGTTGDARITANWQLRDIVTNTVTACPTGFDTAAVYAQPVTATGANAGSVIVDLFNCAANTGTTAPLPAARYLVWVEIANTNNTSVYAKSLSAYVDVTVSDKTFSAQILNDGGYFQLAWLLRGETSNNALTCAEAGAGGGVETVATDVSNATNSASDRFTCEDGAGVTAGFSAATYTVAVAVLNSADESIGTAPALTNRVIAPRNAVTDLGTITIPITGL
jgi:cysteine-rich repeat protein